MKIGYSISFGVCDIHLGLVKIEEVKEIQAGTKYVTEEDWAAGMEYMKAKYWKGFEAEAEQIVATLREQGKIVQPRLTHECWSHPSVASAVWVEAY